MPDAWSVEANVSDHDEQAILTLLREHNWRVNEPFMASLAEASNAPRPVRLVCRAGSDVVGGLLGSTQFSWLRVDVLAVAESHRRRGVASTLLDGAESLAVERGCRYAYLESMEYHGADFYPTRGYEAAGTLPDWDSLGHTKLIFAKRLA